MNASSSVRRTHFALRGTLACLLVACGAVHAVSLNPRGLGEILIYPYYTVNKNQDTLVTIGNSTDFPKEIAVVVREGMNGRALHWFRLYLSAHDVWTARISAEGSESGAVLFTSDTSCTRPLLDPGGFAFSAEAFDGSGLFPADGGPTGLERTREGTIEFVEVAQYAPGGLLDATITHLQTGTPGEGERDCDPDAIFEAITRDGTGVAPTGGLHGSAAIVNVAEGTFFGYSADAIADFSDVSLAFSMALPWALLQVANSEDSLVGGAIAHVLDADGKPKALDFAYGSDAISAIFMAEALVNDYLVASPLGANTDWVVTLPTRMLHVDSYYNGGEARPPFVRPAIEARADVAVHPHVYDQEEGFAPCPDCGDGTEVAPLMLPWQVNVLSFRALGSADAPSQVLGSRLATSVEPWGDAGWMQLDLANGDGGHALGADLGGSLHGLPATGFMVYNIINANAAPGRLANYGGAFAHRASVAHSQTPADAAQ
jgi:hypothetical protein